MKSNTYRDQQRMVPSFLELILPLISLLQMFTLYFPVTEKEQLKINILPNATHHLNHLL